MDSTLRFGYASQNLRIPATTGRTMRLAGIADGEKMAHLVHENLSGLAAILRWNSDHHMGLFRLSQQIVPFASHPSFPYDWQQQHGSELRRLGLMARRFNIRLSLHPGQFIQPGSPNPGVSQRSLAELRYVASLLSYLAPDDGVLVVHLGGSHGDKATASENFVTALTGEDAVLRYLALENDERVWTVDEVVNIALRLRVPAIVDTLHHALNPGSLTLAEALHVAFPTWTGRPKLHLSSQDPSKQRGAHAWGIEPVDFQTLLGALGGRGADVMVEAKGKEQAVEILQASAGL